MTGNLKENLSFLKYAREFEREYMRTNYNRIVPVTIILYIFEWIIFFKNNLFLNTGCVILVFQTYNTFLVPLIFYAHKHFESLSICKLKIINYLYLIGIIAFGAFLVYTTRDQLDLLHIFLMMVLSIGALIYIHPKESLWIIVLPAILFISGLYIFQYNADILCIYATNTLIFTVVIYILSANLFVQKVKDLHMLKELKKEIEKLEKQTKIDEMTGLYTHKAIFDIIAVEIERAKRYNTELTVLLIDIDDFKRLNDKRGHIYGDLVIKELARNIKENIRINDYAGRYGGDEFLILLLSTDVTGAENLYDRIIDDLLHSECLCDEKVTVSAGITTYNNEDIYELIKTVDSRLYAAKHAGKAKYVSKDNL